MHHAPSGPSFSERLIERVVSTLYRALRPTHDRSLLVRPRPAGILLGSVVIGLLVATLPMVSTASDAPASAALKGSSAGRTGASVVQGAQAARSDVVVMGVDGAPASSAGSSSAAPTDAAPAPAAVAPGAATVASGSTSSSAAGSAPVSAGPAVAPPTTPGPSTLAQPPVTLPVPPVVTSPSPSPSPSPTPTVTSASPSPSPTTDPSPQP